MDKIQKTLIKAGHKDLAQEYYLMTKSADSATKQFKQSLVRMLQQAVRQISVSNNTNKIVDVGNRTVDELRDLIQSHRYTGIIP